MRFAYCPSLLILTLAACTVGPDYTRPQLQGADGRWSVAASTEAVDLEPWRDLGDPLLVELIERAVGANLDLREADARLREARAGRDAAAGGRLPQAQAQGSQAERQISNTGVIPFGQLPGFDRTFSLFDAGFDASWEIDLWGGSRRAVEAATRRVELADARRREVRLRVIAEVERTYAELRGAQALAELLRSEAEAQGRQADLLRQLREHGEVALSDEANAEVLARQAQAASAGAEAQVRAAANGLALLTAQPPEQVVDRLLAPADIPRVPEQISAGLRSDMLRRRPDIMAAEAQLAAATADIGVEKAKLFPKLSLTGSIGWEDRSGDDLFTRDSTRYSAGPMLSWPIFAGGRIKAQVRAASARAEAAGAAYERAIIGALADSETAINRYAAAVARAQALEAARKRSAESLRLAEMRYRRGEDSLVAFLIDQSRDNAARRAAASTRMEALEAHAALVKALGGGWTGAPPDVAGTSECREGDDGACASPEPVTSRVGSARR